MVPDFLHIEGEYKNTQHVQNTMSNMVYILSMGNI